MMWAQTVTNGQTTQTSQGEYNVPREQSADYWFIYATKKASGEEAWLWKSNQDALVLHIVAERQRFNPASARVERHGFQQMARLPCYRGTRTR